MLLTQNCRRWWANRKLDTYREDNSTCDVVFRCIRKREEKNGDRVKEMNKKYRDERKSEVSKCTKEFHREDDCLICGCKVRKCKKIRHVKGKNHLLGWVEKVKLRGLVR